MFMFRKNYLKNLKIRNFYKKHTFTDYPGVSELNDTHIISVACKLMNKRKIEKYTLTFRFL